METQSNLEEVYRIQAFGGRGKFEMTILLDAGRDLTDTDKSNIREAAEEIQKKILQETIRLNPKSSFEASGLRKELLDLFTGHAIFVKEIPNGYCSDYCCKHLPWFIVTTEKGPITIGWRKRVIEIDWSDSIIPHKAEELFKNENVTKEDKYIHAWGLEKAKEYIDKLLTSKEVIQT